MMRALQAQISLELALFGFKGPITECCVHGLTAFDHTRCSQFNSIQFIFITPNHNKCYLKALQ